MPHLLNWTPGENGKGLISEDGHLHTWNLSHIEDGGAGIPTHFDYKDKNNIASPMESEFWINPEGDVSFYQPHNVDQSSRELIKTLAPHLNLTDVSNDEGIYWNFM